MILEWYCGKSTTTEATSETFQRLRTKLGGLDLARRCLSLEAFENAHVMFICSRPCWSWYSWHIENIKTAKDNLQYQIELSKCKWTSEWHLHELAKMVSPNGVPKFEKLMNHASDQDSLASKIFGFSVELLGLRCATYSRYCTPPFCYVGSLDDDPLQQVQARRLMVSDLQWLLRLEGSSSAAEGQNLASDLRLTLDACTRLACMCQWNNLQETASALLRTMLCTLPDSKCVEDSHQVVRVAQRASGNEKLTCRAVQYLCQTSKIFSSRDLKHGPAVTYDTFHDQFHGTKPVPNDDFNASKHKLEKLFGNILAKRDWIAMSEPNLANSAAAWTWSRHYASAKLSLQGIFLKDWSKNCSTFVMFFLNIF